MIVHVPVLLEQVLRYLAPRGGNELLIDATVGEGGHSYAFLSRFPDLSVVALDADASILAVARERLSEFGERMRFYTGWSQDFFSDYPVDLKRPDSVLIDLGISSFHYEKSGRGFSFSGAEKLDMRLDTTKGISAAELLTQRPEKEIADIIYNNAGERYSRRIARAIVRERQRGAISTAAVLSELVKQAVPASYSPIHPATRTFMALRIAVNGELERLPELLEGALKVLKPGGRLGVISFHSLEDRVVKNFFKMKNKACNCPPQKAVCECAGLRSVNILTPKGVAADEDEIRRNPPSRSARLRVAEKIAGAE